MLKKKLKVSLIALTIFGSFYPVLQACSSKTDTENPKAEKVMAKADEGKIIHIDAAYMKEHIFDYEANPTEFVYKGNVPAILDFYADWCGPCRSLSPKLEEVAKKYAGKLIVYKINVDKEPALAQMFGANSIPMVLFIPVKGTPIQTMGNIPMKDIESTIQKIMK